MGINSLEQQNERQEGRPAHPSHPLQEQGRCAGSYQEDPPPDAGAAGGQRHRRGGARCEEHEGHQPKASVPGGGAHQPYDGDESDCEAPEGDGHQPRRDDPVVLQQGRQRGQRIEGDRAPRGDHEPNALRQGERDEDEQAQQRFQKARRFCLQTSPQPLFCRGQSIPQRPSGRAAPSPAMRRQKVPSSLPMRFTSEFQRLLVGPRLRCQLPELCKRRDAAGASRQARSGA